MIGKPGIQRLAEIGPGPVARFNARIRAEVLPWRADGVTLRECAQRLNDRGQNTFRGKPWSVSRLCQVVGIFEKMRA